MLTLNDGRAELWQWDTGRTLSVDADCSQVHFSNKFFGRSIDVDVVGGVAIIPDILLQTDKDVSVWAFVGTAESGYTKISKTFKVNRRNKPADYVFTPPDQTSLEEIKEKIDYLESIQDPDAIKNAVNDYLEQNPVEAPVQSVNGKTGTVELTAKDVGAISQGDLQEATNNALAQAKASGEFDGAGGKSAYAYAVEGSYTGTEAEFAAKLAQEKFANPNALTFTGAVTGSYDGSAPLTVNIPEGGGGTGGGSSEGIGELRRIAKVTLTEDASSIEITTDEDGNVFELVEYTYLITGKSLGASGNVGLKINDSLIYYGAELSNSNTTATLISGGHGSYVGGWYATYKAPYNASNFDSVKSACKENVGKMKKFWYGCTSGAAGVGFQAGTVLELWGR